MPELARCGTAEEPCLNVDHIAFHLTDYPNRTKCARYCVRRSVVDTIEIMQKARSFPLSRLLTILAALLIWKVTLSVVLEYRNYFPPNFESDFLRGRERYFWGAYRWAFYTHLVSGPTSLILGTILVSSRFRRTVPTWHRWLGRMQAACVLLLVAPSGLWMAYYAATGSVAAAGLGSLAIATAACVVLGWRSAVRRRLVNHRRWMWRTFILLCSAVVIRHDRWIGDGRSFRCPMALPAFDVDELARAAADFRVQPVSQPAYRTCRDIRLVRLLSNRVVIPIDRNQRTKCCCFRIRAQEDEHYLPHIPLEHLPDAAAWQACQDSGSIAR